MHDLVELKLSLRIEVFPCLVEVNSARQVAGQGEAASEVTEALRAREARVRGQIEHRARVAAGHVVLDLGARAGFFDLQCALHERWLFSEQRGIALERGSRQWRALYAGVCRDGSIRGSRRPFGDRNRGVGL